jgi:hypothetical protein
MSTATTESALIFAWGDGPAPELDRFSEIAESSAEYPFADAPQWAQWWEQADAPWGCLFEIPGGGGDIEGDLRGVLSDGSIHAIAGWDYVSPRGVERSL